MATGQATRSRAPAYASSVSPPDRFSEMVVQPHVEAAQQAFWEVVAQRFPEITTGDLPPEAATAFDEACYHVVWSWLGANTGP